MIRRGSAQERKQARLEAAAHYAAARQRAAEDATTTPKRVIVAAALGLLFGPLGMIYSTMVGAFVMLLVSLVVGFVTLGKGLVVVWPICALWAWQAAKTYNASLESAQGSSSR